MNRFRGYICLSNRYTLITAAVGIMLLAAINSADAASNIYVQITGKDQGTLTTACNTRKGMENYCSSPSYSSSIGFPVDSTLPKYGPVQMVLVLNRVHPRLLTAMVNREPLKVTVNFFAQNQSGVDYVYHSVTLDNAKVIDVRRWTENTAPLAAGYYDYSTVSFDYTSITETNYDGSTSFIGSQK